MREALYSNIILCGGNAKLKNFRERIYIELRTMVPDIYELNVFTIDEYATLYFFLELIFLIHYLLFYFKSPIVAAWKGGALLQQDSQYENMCATRQQYNESGHVVSKLFTN